jgi:hypothetical protein
VTTAVCVCVCVEVDCASERAARLRARRSFIFVGGR